MQYDSLFILLKLITPTLLLISAIAILKAGYRARGFWLAWAGLATTMIGDYFIALKCSPPASTGYLYGIAGFALAQICWIAFLLRHARWNPRVAATLTFSLGIFYAVRVVPAVNSPPLLWAVALYAAISIFSVSLAYGRHHLSRAWRWGLGLLLFSDVLIVQSQLLHVPHLKMLIGVSYLASLLCMASAICRCAHAPDPLRHLDELRHAPWLLLGGTLLTVLGFASAMRLCPVTPPYNPLRHMLSFLGRTRIGSIEYPLCYHFFMFSLAGSALICARFIPALSCFVRGKFLKSLFLWCGALNVSGLLTIALVPENTICALHNVGCFAAVIGGGGMLLLLTPARNNWRVSSKLRWGMTAWALLLVTLFEAALLSHRLKWLPFSPYVPTLQKLLILTFGAWFSAYAYILARRVRSR